MNLIGKTISRVSIIWVVILSLPNVFAAESYRTLSDTVSQTASDQLSDVGDLPISGINLTYGRLIADIKVNQAYNDNITYANINTEDAFITTLTPHLGYILEGRTRTFTLDYQHTAALYSSTSDDNFNNNKFRASFDYDPSRRIDMGVNAFFLTGVDKRGEGRAEGGPGTLQATPDEWHEYGIGGIFSYGADDAIGKIEIELGYKGRRYDSNEQFTFLRDRDDLNAAARFYYRVGPKTRALLELKNTDYDYINETPGIADQDGSNTRYLIGIDWQATFKTSGFMKVGISERTFDSSLREDNTSLTWELGKIWRPRSYSTVYISSVHNTSESNGTGDSIDSSTHLVSWDHQWRPKIGTSINGQYGQDTFSGSSREDELYSFNFRVKYDIKRWLNLSTGYQYSVRSSNFSQFDFDQNIFDISAVFSL